MVTLSGFIDEAIATLGGQLRMAQAAGLTHIELRRVGVRPVTALSARQARRARRLLEERGLHVSCIAASVGKRPATAPLAPQLDDLRRAIATAHRFGTDRVRTFSWFTRSPDTHRSLILEQMDAVADVAEAEGVTLLHENEKGIFGDTPERCRELVAVTGGRLRLIVDPANFVQCGVQPLRAWHLLRAHADMLHAKDARSATGRVVPVGQGDGQWPALAADVAASGWSGVVALEPHLGLGGRGGPVAPTGWVRALGATRGVLDAAGVPISG